MNLHDTLKIKKTDTVAIIGAGGKTTMLWLLAKERKEQGAFVTTSTHIMKPDNSECDIIIPTDSEKYIIKNKIIASLDINENNKCTGLIENNYNIPILYEADGSKRLPAKFHNTNEPVIYKNTDVVILVLGLSCLGKPIKDVCHRYELLNLNPNEIFNIKHLIMCIDDGIKSCKMPKHKIRIFLNQLDVISNKEIIHNLCKTLKYPYIFCGNLKSDG